MDFVETDGDRRRFLDIYFTTIILRSSLAPGNLLSPRDVFLIFIYFRPYMRSDTSLAESFVQSLFRLIERTHCRNRFIILWGIKKYLKHRYCRLNRHLRRLLFAFCHDPACAANHAPLHLGHCGVIMGNFHPILWDFKTVKRLLRYGVEFLCPSIETEPYRRIANFNLRSVQLCGLEIDIEQATSPVPNLTTQRRMQVVFLAVSVVGLSRLMRFQSRHIEFIQSVKLLFEAMPHPIVTATEISRYLRGVTKGPNKERDIAKFIEEYVEVFPEAAGPPQPRKLKQLCRCTVRKRLSDSRTVPSAMWSENIPVALKRYIMIEETEE